MPSKGKPEMNKLTKGAIATAAGVILLMGGAGTLASWNSSATAGASQSINAGQLTVASAGTGIWKNAAGATITPSSYKIVPGDALTYSQTFNVTASGDALYFTVASTPGTFGSTTAGTPSAALAAQLSNTAAYSVTGNSIALTGTTAGVYKVSTGTTASTVVVTMTITFPYGTSVDNSAQLGTVTLGAGAVTLTQVQNP
jgi:alternate signal-mediated exported protein